MFSKSNLQIFPLFFLVSLFIFCSTQSSQAAAFNDVADGNWSNPATWGGGPPGAGDTVTIDSNTVTLDGNVTVTSVTFSGTRSFNGNGNTLTATGDITLNDPTVLTITGHTALHAGTAAGAFTMNSNSSITDDVLTYNLSLRASDTSPLQSITMNGTLTLGPGKDTCTTNFVANQTITTGGILVTNAGIPNNTVTLVMGDKDLTVNGNMEINYDANPTGVINTGTGSTHVTGDVILTAAVSSISRIIVGDGSTLTIDGNLSAAGTDTSTAHLRMNIGASSTLNIAGNWTMGSNTNFAGDVATVNFEGGGTSTLISGGHDFNILNITNGTTVRAQTNALEAATLNVTNGTLDMATNDLALTVTGTLTTAAGQNYSTGTGSQTINTLDNSGIVTCEGAGADGSNLLITTMTNNAGSTFRYTKADAITSVKQGTYHHLTFGELGGASLYSLGGTVNANGNLTHDNGTLAVFGNTLNITGASDINSDISISTGTINAGGAWDGTGSTLTFSDEGELILSGAVTAVATSRAGAFGVVEYNGTAAQTVDNGITYHDLTIDNSGVAVATQEAGGDLDVDGDFTISDADASFTADNANSLDIAGNYTNNGTFTHSNGTVTLNGATAQNVTTGSSNWNELEITNASVGGVTFVDGFTAASLTDITPNSRLNFRFNETFEITAVGGLNLNGQAVGTRIILRRDGGAGNDQWEINPSGGTWTVSYVDVQNSLNSAATAISPSDSLDSGNNTNWFVTLPTKPVGSAPTGTGISLTPALESSAYAGANPHLLTQWQIASDAGFANLIFEEISSANKETIQIPPAVLNPTVTYHWRTRYSDLNGYSNWSDGVQFTTENLPDFLNANADIQDAMGAITSTSEGNVVLAFRQSADNLSSTPSGYEFTNDVFSFKIENVTPGAVVQVTFQLDTAFLTTDSWPKFYPTMGVWDTTYGDGDNIIEGIGTTLVTLQFKDGGFGDIDGVANGTIVDPSGPAFNASSTSGGGSSGENFFNCFIATASYNTPMADEVVTLRDFRDKHLLSNPPGKIFVKSYYKASPGIAEFISKRPVLKNMVKKALKPVVWLIGNIEE